MTDQGASASGSGGGKRPRGRPLKATADEEESAIKRRARVRKAQQAFQKRKEAAAQSLREQLLAVQNGLEEFSTSFSNFTTTVAQSGVADTHPELLRQLHGLTEQLLALARTASPDSPQGPTAASAPTEEQEQEPDPPPSPPGLVSQQSFSTSVSPGVEHLFLSDADPSPSKASSEEDVQVACAFTDDAVCKQLLETCKDLSSSPLLTSLCSTSSATCCCDLVLRSSYGGHRPLTKPARLHHQASASSGGSRDDKTAAVLFDTDKADLHKVWPPHTIDTSTRPRRAQRLSAKPPPSIIEVRIRVETRPYRLGHTH